MGDQTTTSMPTDLALKSKSQLFNPYVMGTTLGIGYLIYNKKTRKLGIGIGAGLAFMLWQYARAFR
jgi:hypothetical protein